MNRYGYMDRPKAVLPSGYNWCEADDCVEVSTNQFKSRTLNGKKWLCGVHHIQHQGVHDLINGVPYRPLGLNIHE